MVYLYLVAAIVFEVVGTSAMKLSDGFTRPLPAAVTALTYAAAFYFLALVLRSLPVGIAYAIWAGLGIVLITMVGVFWFRQPLDLPAVVGLVLILAGVLVINLFSKTMVH